LSLAIPDFAMALLAIQGLPALAICLPTPEKMRENKWG